jgi:hypothetical protein
VTALLRRQREKMKEEECIEYKLNDKSIQRTSFIYNVPAILLVGSFVLGAELEIMKSFFFSHDLASFFLLASQRKKFEYSFAPFGDDMSL